MLNKVVYYVRRLFKRENDLQRDLLRSYLKRGSEDTLKDCEQLVGSDEALKHFGNMWGEYKVDTMMMFTAIEYEYIQNYDFTESELKVLRHVIGNIGLFYRGCKVAHDSKVELQEMKSSLKT